MAARTMTPGMVKKIGVVRSQLHWSNDDHQAVLEKIGVKVNLVKGRRSANDMDYRQFEAYLRHAVGCGFKEVGKAIKAADAPSNAQLHRITELRSRIITARLGVVTDENREQRVKEEHAYVEGVVKKATRARPERWWTRHEASQVIDGLTEIARRLD